MKHFPQIARSFLLGSLILHAFWVSAQDWPQWRGPARDGKTTGFSAPVTWPRELTKKWSVQVGLGDATPALVDGKLYVFSRVGDQEATRCLEADTGKELWQQNYPVPQVQGPDLGHAGPRSSPAVSAGKLVQFGVFGHISCLDTATGKVLWRKTDYTNSCLEFHTSMSPLIVGGLAILQMGSENQGALMALELATGEPKWKWAGEGASYSSPVFMNAGNLPMVIAESSQSLAAVSLSDGKLLWRTSFQPKAMAYNASTPVVKEQVVIFSGQGRGTRAVRLENKSGAIQPRELWWNADCSVGFNSPVLLGDYLFGLSQRGRFFCINTFTGRTAWAETKGGRGEFGALVQAGPVLLALTATGLLTIIDPSPKDYTQLAQYKVSDKQTYAHPVPSGKRIFIKDQDSLTLWTLE